MTKTSALVGIVFELQDMESITNAFYDTLKSYETCGNVYTEYAAAAKSLQSCPTLCNPIDGSPPGSPVLGILQARTLDWVAISFPNAWKWRVKVTSLSRVSLLATPWTAAYQAPPSMGFSRQERDRKCKDGGGGVRFQTAWSGQDSEHRVFGSSLVVQWLRLWACNLGGPSSIPGQGTRVHTL